MRYLAIIPARKGSKRLPNKNIKILSGKPLIQHTIELAKDLFSPEDICVTTDSEEVVKIAESCGVPVPFIRPEAISQDKTAMREVMLHAIDYYLKKGIDYDAVVMLQPTSPFRYRETVKKGFILFNKTLDMVTTVHLTKSNPYFVLFEEKDNGYLQKCLGGNYTSAQECPKVWELNGVLYVININSLLKQNVSDFKKVVKLEISGKETLDIDTELDFKFAEMLSS